MATYTKKPTTQVIKKQREPERGFFRRFVFNRYTLTVFFALLFIAISGFTYFYFKYSSVIDSRLRGAVLIRTTAIYAAPRPIRIGEALSQQSLKGYLDGIGYVQSTKDADAKRGRYLIKGSTIDVRTGSAASGSVGQFPNVAVTFSSSGRSITKISDLDSKRNYDSVLLEPGLLTEVSNDGHQKQKLVSFKDLPKDFVDATLAIEDREFFEHPGINFRGLFRAVLHDVGEGEKLQGGSSITQQLVKNFFLTPERTFKRKVQEMMMALVLETKLSKEQIFQLYANEVFMGQSGAYSINGVGEAASTYFNKDVVNLTLPESAFLAGIIRGPSLYSPYRDPARAKARRNQVLDSMAQAGFITQAQADQAKATDLNIQAKRNAANSGSPYFVDYLQQQLTTDLAGRDIGRQSYRVYTTIDLDLQRAANNAVDSTLTELDKIFEKRRKNPVPAGTLQAALVALDAKTGNILAMVGGRDYSRSQLNRAVDAHRQPGSVFKPIVYATALNSAYEDSGDHVLTPASMFLDSPETFYYGGGQSYSPENFGKVYSNEQLLMREGLVHSLNVVTVRIAEKVGYDRIVKMAERLGLPRPQPFPALALGTAEATPLQVARAYTAFANYGNLAETRPVTEITNADGSEIADEKPDSHQVLRPTISWLITNMLQDVLNRGTAARARSMGFSATAAGKTGTSHDGWFAGYTPNMVCVVWVGFDDNSELGLEGAKSALPIWTNFMKQALAMRPDLGGDSFPMPEGIVTADIDPTTGMLATEGCPAHTSEYFVEGTQPTEPCAVHSAGALPVPAPIPFVWPEDAAPRPKQTETPDLNKSNNLPPPPPEPEASRPRVYTQRPRPTPQPSPP